MLSNETKLSRINYKLREIGIVLKFDCYDLKNLTPTYYNLEDVNGVKKDNPYVHIGVKVNVENNKNIVFLYVDNVKFMPLHTFTDFERYSLNIQNIYNALEYCNKLKLEVPEYIW